MPQISIIVPNYNTEKYLSRCIESLIHQTFKDIEIILVDDGSKDMRLFSKNRTYLIRKKNLMSIIFEHIYNRLCLYFWKILKTKSWRIHYQKHAHRILKNKYYWRFYIKEKNDGKITDRLIERKKYE